MINSFTEGTAKSFEFSKKIFMQGGVRTRTYPAMTPHGIQLFPQVESG